MKKKYPLCKRCRGAEVILVKERNRSEADYYEPCPVCMKEDIEREESDRYDLSTCHTV